MVIQTSEIGMKSRRSFRSEGAVVQAYGGFRKALRGAAESGEAVLMDLEEKKEGQEEKKECSLEELIEKLNVGRSERRIGIGIDTGNVTRRVQKSALSYLFAMLFGKKYHLRDGGSLSGDLTGGSSEAGPGSFSGGYREASFYHEEEETSFETQGVVRTADGREVSFQLELSMSRSFTEVYERSFGTPDFMDPLVINLNAPAAEVKDQKFYFDLDADGHEEAVHMLGPGSGFLALDKNGDGRIGDGSELFGTASGNGFRDLMAYDSDGNGWIDEADEIFEKLLIYSKGADGSDQLIGLGKAGVGAIFLGSAETEFSLNRLDNNEAKARIRSTGIFLYEDGGMGTVQQLDLAQ